MIANHNVTYRVFGYLLAIGLVVPLGTSCAMEWSDNSLGDTELLDDSADGGDGQGNSDGPGGIDEDTGVEDSGGFGDGEDDANDDGTDGADDGDGPGDAPQEPSCTEIGDGPCAGTENGFGINVAQGKSITVDSTHLSYEGSNAVDGDSSPTNSTRWLSADSAQTHWIEVDLGGCCSVNQMKTYFGYDGVYDSEHAPSQYRLKYWDGSAWKTIVDVAGNTDPTPMDSFEVIKTTKVRWETDDDILVRMFEMELFEAPDVAEVAELAHLTDAPQTVTFDTAHLSPVVIALPAGYNETDPVQPRVYDVRDNGFTIKLQEPGYLDGIHLAEPVHYLAVEEGSWQLSDGTRIQAGTFSLTSDKWEWIPFEYSFSETPVLFVQTQTNNGVDWVVTRVKDRTSGGFRARLQEEEASDSYHATETVGYVAIDPPGTAKIGTWNGHAYEAKLIDVLDEWTTHSFSAVFAQPPRLFAQIVSWTGGDPVVLRYRDLATAQVDMFIQEETSNDGETGHEREYVSVFALNGDGTHSAVPYYGYFTSPDGEIHCPTTCNSCGTASCSSAPGSANSCCIKPIAQSGHACDRFEPPCFNAPACTASGTMSYTLHKESEPTPEQQAAYEKITAAVDAAVGMYNCFLNTSKALNVYYNPNVPTAQANINGKIDFGGSISFQTALHEIQHTLGVGTHDQWDTLCSSGWNGPAGTALVRTISGNPSAKVNCDGSHFWPHGLNYAKELNGPVDIYNHVRMVGALRQDMGI